MRWPHYNRLDFPGCESLMSDVSRILSQIESGDRSAAEQLLPLVYDELRKLAATNLAREKPGQTLQATALVHEAYLRLIGPANRDGFDSRGHFFAAAAEAMRRILVERARRSERLRHAGNFQKDELSAAAAVTSDRSREILRIDTALDDLALQDPRAAEIVKLRFFVGMSHAEVAAALGISTRTVERTWVYAKAWLRESLGQ
jgi:RNA polymerase sigma factor (TIGR02999 family)